MKPQLRAGQSRLVGVLAPPQVPALSVAHMQPPAQLRATRARGGCLLTQYTSRPPAGVPLRHELPDLDIFAAEDGRAVLGADLPECPGSALPGRCAFEVLVDATSACVHMEECESITMYWKGEPSPHVCTLCTGRVATVWHCADKSRPACRAG